MGAKVGKRVFLGNGSYVTSEFDLITIGDDTTINEEAELKCSQVKDRVLILKKINVGNNVTVSGKYSKATQEQCSCNYHCVTILVVIIVRIVFISIQKRTLFRKM